MKTFFFQNNYFFFLKNLFFFKKNNSSFKKIPHQNYNSNLDLKQGKNFSNVIKKKNNKLNKYFFFFENINSSNYFTTLNTKIVDLKKKFMYNLYDFKNTFNLILNKKKIKKKSLFKNFNYFFFFFKKNNFFFDFSLINVLIKLKYVFNYSDYYFLKFNNFLFLNRKSINYTNKNLNIFKSDIIELTTFSLFFKYLLKINFYYNNWKIKNSFKTKKKKINFIFFDYFNKSLSLENSFKINSVIVLNNVLTQKFASNYLNFFVSFYLIKLYKWRY